VLDPHSQCIGRAEKRVLRVSQQFKGQAETYILVRFHVSVVSQPSAETHPLFGTDERARTLRLFMLALIGTPWLLFIEPARRIVSLETTLAAIGLGAGLGVVAAVGLADVNYRDVNDVMASVVALGCIGVATVVVWLLVPHQYIGTVVQFALAFTWAMPVAKLLYNRYRAPESS